MGSLNIYNRRERLLVRTADLLLSPLRLRRRRRPADRPASILCFRLERIGDLLMTLPALSALRAAAPGAAIDLVVGSWNAEIARAIPGIRNVEILDAAWLARGGGGASVWSLLRRARSWRGRYDLAINFEPDIRTNLVAAADGASRVVGFSSGGGGALLDVAIPQEARTHTADQCLAVVAAAIGASSPAGALRLQLDPAVRARAQERLAEHCRPIVAVHVSGGRAVKQWPEERFAAVARWLATERDATLMFTGATEDRAQIARVIAAVGSARVVDASGADLIDAAAMLEHADAIVTGDTGPMHLAHAVGTPVVAVFGPSDPVRYAPRGVHDRIVRIDLPCAPCNRIRLPPARCCGVTPDCLAGVSVDHVIAAVAAVLDAARAAGRRVPTVA